MSFITKANALLVLVLAIWGIAQALSERTFEIPVEFKSIDVSNEDSSPHHLRQLNEMSLGLNSLNLPFIKLRIGTPGEDVELSLTSYQSMVFIGDQGFSSGRSQTYQTDNKSVKIAIQSRDYFGTLSQDTISLAQDISMQHFPFIYIRDELIDYNYQGTVGFPYLCPHLGGIENANDYSFLHQLKKHGHTDNEIVSIGYRKDSPFLVLGNYPKEEWLNKKVYRTCKLIDVNEYGDLNPNWECDLDSVYMNNDYLYKVKRRVLFSIGGNVVTVCEDFFNEVIERYFKRDIELKACKVVEVGELKRLECLENYINGALNELAFVIGKWNIKLSSHNMFQEIRRKQVLSLNLIVQTGKKSLWTLPFSLFKDNFFIFDKETKTMGLLQSKEKLLIPA